MKGRAYIVIGPESTGTRMTTRLLLSKGCLGDAEHRQKWDKEDFKGTNGDPVVWRKSVPHGVEWPNMLNMKQKLMRAGYKNIVVVITSRDWYPQACSMAKMHMRDMKDYNKMSEFEKIQAALERTQKAYAHIFREIENAALPFILTNYESIVTDMRSVNALMKQLGLPLYETEEYLQHKLTNRNDKWFN